MNAEAQLAYEARVRNRQAIVAILAGVLLVAASAVSWVDPTPRSTS